MIGSAITYIILAISGLIGSGIAIDEIGKAKHRTRNRQAPGPTQPGDAESQV